MESRRNPRAQQRTSAALTLGGRNIFIDCRHVRRSFAYIFSHASSSYNLQEYSELTRNAQPLLLRSAAVAVQNKPKAMLALISLTLPPPENSTALSAFFDLRFILSSCASVSGYRSRRAMAKSFSRTCHSQANPEWSHAKAQRRKEDWEAALRRSPMFSAPLRLCMRQVLILERLKTIKQIKSAFQNRSIIRTRSQYIFIRLIRTCRLRRRGNRKVVI